MMISIANGDEKSNSYHIYCTLKRLIENDRYNSSHANLDLSCLDHFNKLTNISVSPMTYYSINYCKVSAFVKEYVQIKNDV